MPIPFAAAARTLHALVRLFELIAEAIKRARARRTNRKRQK